MTKTQKLIGRVFASLPEMHHGFHDCDRLLLDECVAAERQHRRGRGSVRGFTPVDAGRYFAAAYLHGMVTGARKVPEVGDYLSFRHELYTAAAIVHENREALTAWAATVPAEFVALDYCDLMQPERTS